MALTALYINFSNATTPAWVRLYPSAYLHTQDWGIFHFDRTQERLQKINASVSSQIHTPPPLNNSSPLNRDGVAAIYECLAQPLSSIIFAYVTQQSMTSATTLRKAILCSQMLWSPKCYKCSYTCLNQQLILTLQRQSPQSPQSHELIALIVNAVKSSLLCQ